MERQKCRHTLREEEGSGGEYFDDNPKRTTDKNEDVSRRCTLSVESDQKETSGAYRLGNV